MSESRWIGCSSRSGQQPFGCDFARRWASGAGSRCAPIGNHFARRLAFLVFLVFLSTWLQQTSGSSKYYFISGSVAFGFGSWSGTGSGPPTRPIAGPGRRDTPTGHRSTGSRRGVQCRRGSPTIVRSKAGSLGWGVGAASDGPAQAGGRGSPDCGDRLRPPSWG